MGRLGLLGGTFDPIHIGHLILASVVADTLALDKVWFVPAADPPHKRDRLVTPVDHRIAMVQLAIEGNSRFQLSRIDVDRAGPHYAVDTVALAQEQRPGDTLYFLMGSDSLRDLPKWYQPQPFIKRCRLAVLKRPGVVVDMEQLEAALPGLGERVAMVEGPGVAISATEIGRRVQAGHNIRYLVPEAVEAYIAKHNLYQNKH